MLNVFRALLSGDGLGLEEIVHICVLIFITVCCFPVHESAHAWMAEKLGDSTGKLKGRITMNPLAHLNLVGTLMILLFGFGFAKPVPVNIRNFPAKKRKGYFALTALAGPVSNLILALIFCVFQSAARFALEKTGSEVVMLQVTYYFFMYAAYVNISLAVFNLVPIPPLDGSRLLTAALPDRIYYKIMQYERYSMIALFLLIYLFEKIGISPLSWISNGLMRIFSAVTYLPFSFFI